MYFLIAAALLPAVILMYYIYRKDRVEKEPGRLLWRLFLLGVLSAIPAAILETILGRVLRIFDGVLYQLLSAFIGVALVEEGCKLFFLRRGSWRSPAFDYRFDGLVYAVFVSLGFAGIENILYVFQYGMGVAVSRALFSIPGHMAFGVFMGVYYSEAKAMEAIGRPDRCRGRMILALIIPVLLHGFYDFCLFMQSELLFVVFLVFAIVLDIIMVGTVRCCSKRDAPLPGVAFSQWGREEPR